MNGVMDRLRGRLPFDGKSKEEILDQVIRGVPDYNNKSFMRLSPNVGLNLID